MNVKEQKMKDILRLKSDAAEAKLSQLANQIGAVEKNLGLVIERRKNVPEDPRDQLVYERHLAWLDVKARELSMKAAQLKVQMADAKRDLGYQFGRKLAFDKMLKKLNDSAKSK
jgi:hypothetical protein